MAVICVGDIGICTVIPDIVTCPVQFSYRIII